MKKTKKLVLCAICSALGVVILMLGSLIEVLDLTVAMLVSLLILFCVAEFGYSYALAVYFVISALSFLLLPSKGVALLFAGFFGYVPMTKFVFERFLGRWLSWIPKLLLFNGAAVLVALFGQTLIGFTFENQLGISKEWMIAAYFVIANGAFILCDILYGRLTLLYLNRYRNKIRKYLK